MSLPTQCIFCIHHLGDYKCKAFLDGIPQELLTGERSHNRPYPGDHGFRFTPNEKWLKLEESYRKRLKEIEESQ